MQVIRCRCTGERGKIRMKLKRFASLLLSAALLLTMAVPAFAAEEPAAGETAVLAEEPAAEAAAPEQKPLTYVAIGDSVTAGVGLDDLKYKIVPSGYDMTENYTGYSSDCFVAYVADKLGLDRDHAINLGLPAVMTGDLADLIETGAMPAMNQYSGVQYKSVPELQEYIKQADVITLQVGSNDALIRTIVALGNATNWKSEKLANGMVAGLFRNLSGSNRDLFLAGLKDLSLTPAEVRAVLKLLTSGMDEICTQTYAQTTANLERIVLDIRALNPDAQILLLSYNNPVPLLLSWTKHFKQLNSFEQHLAAKYDLTYVPIPRTSTANDGHPTISGHRYIGRQIVKAIKKLNLSK